MEKRLAAHIARLDELYYGLSPKGVRELAYEFASRNGLEHRFDNDRKQAGKKWLKSFLERYRFSSRTAEKCSAARASGFNRVQCEKFFDNLSSLYAKYNFSPHCIYNMDESGISTVPNKVPKVSKFK
jgi:hypothetical protein